MNQFVRAYLDGSVSLQELTGHAVGGELQEMESELSAIAERAGFAAAYLMHRGAAGCGDHGHDKAKAAAEKKRKPLRKALGYTHP